MKTIYIKVKIELKDDANVEEVVQEMHYQFEYGDFITNTEIVEILTE